MEICAVVMAAGNSTRMKSAHSKVVFQVAGKPIVKWVSDALFEAGCSEQVYVVGDQQEEIRNILGEHVAYVFQEKRLGTGHAVMQAAPPRGQERICHSTSRRLPHGVFTDDKERNRAYG
ncbi:MAG: NTP transferase domain-containing protein [Clostridiales bacterium]|nr:NTP transferase domain-containing protein [Clostridiales bacterium]